MPSPSTEEPTTKVVQCCDIDPQYLIPGETVSPLAHEKAQRIVETYGEHGIAFKWAPNAHEGKQLGPPTGFAFTVKKTAPILEAPFSPTKLFSGVALLKLPMEKLRFLRAASVGITEGDVIARAASSSLDFSSIDPLLNEGFVGIYVSQDRDANGWSKQLWMAAQAGAVQQSEQLYESMEKYSASTAPISWDQFFFRNGATKDAYERARHNRLRLLYQMGQEVLGIDMMPLKDSTREPMVDMRHISVENISHMVIRATNGSDALTYYSGTVPPSGRVVVCEHPAVGLTLLKGAPREDLPLGGPWKSTDLLAGFPLGTGQGRGAKLRDLIRLQREQQIFISSAVTTTSSPEYRLRDRAFMDAERKLGYPHEEYGQIHLKPLIVRQ